MTTHRQKTINAVTDHRKGQVKRLFLTAMPGWLQSKLVKQPRATPIDDLCNLSKRQLKIRELSEKLISLEDGFNEVNKPVDKSLINSLTKITKTQQALEKRFTNLDRRLKSQSRDHKTVAVVQEPITPYLNQNFQNQQIPLTSENYQINYGRSFKGNFRANYCPDNSQKRYNNLNYQSFNSANYRPYRI